MDLELKRYYSGRCEGGGIPFREGTKDVEGSEFEWYSNEHGDVGIEAVRGDDKAEGFIQGFDTTDAYLKVRGGKHPFIARSDRYVAEGGFHNDAEQIRGLAEMILSGKQVHVFFSAGVESIPGCGKVLTFSLQAPPEDHYVPESPMGIVEMP